MDKKTPPALRGIKLVELMQWGRRFNAWEFTEELGIEPRTLTNYVRQLREDGINIKSQSGADGCYWIEAGESLHPLRFEPDEARVLVIALKTFTSAIQAEHPEFDQAKQLADRIAFMLQPEVVAEINDAQRDFGQELMKMKAVYGVYMRDKDRR